MKKSLVVMGFISLLTANAHASDLFGSLKKASDSVDKAQAKVTETQTKIEDTSVAASTVASSPEQSAVALVKSKLGDKATKAQVKATLGAPASTIGKTDAQVWLYDVSSINASAVQAAQAATALGVNSAAQASKQVAVQFSGNTVSNVSVAKAAK